MKVSAVLVALSISALLPAAPTSTKSPAKHSAPVKGKAVASKPAPAKTAQGAKPPGARTVTGRGRARIRKVSAPSYQTHPDPERYQQIQQALADRGYFKGEVNGQWNDDSVDALKHFQTDQKLDEDGKINALTLRGLGLGAKHDGTSAPMSQNSAAASTNSSATIPDPTPPPVPTEAPTEPPD